MSVTTRRRWLAFFAVLIVVLFAAFLWVRPLLNIGAGYAAKHACSCHFLQGRELGEISEQDLNFSVLGYASLSASEDRVKATFFGLVPRVAVFRPGIGCTLINDDLLPVKDVTKGAAAGAWVEGQVEDAVQLRGEYQNAVDLGMAPVEGGGARGIVIMHKGEIVAEDYAPGYGPRSPLLGWSMTKSLTGLALGAYYHQLDSLDKPSIADFVNQKNLYPAWSGDARAQITLADLLHMNSGLGWNEGYGSLSDATIMLHEQPDMAAYATGMPALEPTGENWVYSSGTTNILADYLDRKVRPQGMSAHQFMQVLFSPIARTLFVEPDQAGKPVGSSYGWATARDWARLGQFMLQDGVWNGDTLVAPGWIDFMREPAVGSDGIYGGQLWLPGPDMPSLPKDAYMMRGFQDQRVFVIPSLELVIARLGHNVDKRTDFDGLVGAVMEVVEQ
ncbi:serine hydrolase [Lewinella sp. 4G2]|uniref:serine hydrolase domain-containing protein n=1 Tax=Lewinella sp. 4G2 TaxID=1803372 RepID=UPI0007B4E3ED|nr:serine hydrolase [Lewinella sp. 4G2]OAV43249.1 hypothetical protein A3850_001495 [Lewinella sp. 4G2]